MKQQNNEFTESGASRSRLYDDGYQDAKQGRAGLSNQLFESKVDYQIYMNGYNDAVASMKSTKKEAATPSRQVAGSQKLDPNSFAIRLEPGDVPFLCASGIVPSVFIPPCSGWEYRL